jgi:hypothetical protein
MQLMRSTCLLTLSFSLVLALVSASAAQAKTVSDLTLQLPDGDLVLTSLGLKANELAGKLLMPSPAIRRIVTRFGISIATCEFVSEAFQVSLTAAAARCVEETPEYMRPALVVSKKGIVKYFVKSRGFSKHIEIGREIPSGSLAKQLSARGPRRKEGHVSAEVWTDIDVDALIKEESILLPAYDTVLTLLHF